MLKVATWNVNSLRSRLSQVLKWLAQVGPDILALQETKVVDQDFPTSELQQAGYQLIYTGQKSYNGVAILSKLPAAAVELELPNFQTAQKRMIAASYAGVRIINLYVPNGQAVGSEKYEFKLSWLAAVRDYIGEALQKYPKLIVLGDFNIAPADEDVYNPNAWHNQVLCSEAERAALVAILSLGLEDSFRLFVQAERVFSWWDYRGEMYTHNRGLRIDHILSSYPLAKVIKNCYIDEQSRQWEKPSDHAPVLAEYNLDKSS